MWIPDNSHQYLTSNNEDVNLSQNLYFFLRLPLSGLKVISEFDISNIRFSETIYLKELDLSRILYTTFIIGQSVIHNLTMIKTMI